MSTTVSPEGAPSDLTVRRFGRYSLFAAIYTYLLIIFGGTVRITESGLGCGDEWPKCNGQWIPHFTLETFIEYMHRLLGVSIGIVLLGLALYAFKHRQHARFAGPGGLTRPAFVVAGLVVLQGLLGAITVWLNLPTAVIVVHFMTALIIMALLLLAAFRAGTLGQPLAAIQPARSGKHKRAAQAALGLGFVLIVLGALTANTTGAPEACQGFPLCNGRLLPAGVSAVHIHWTHRLLALLLLLHVLATLLRASSLRGATRRAGWLALSAVAMQIGIAAAMVLSFLPPQLKVLHLAMGAAVWGLLVVWTMFARAQANHDGASP